MTEPTFVGNAGLETMAAGMRKATRYYQWVYRRISPHLGKRILEVGPGFGNIGGLIIEHGHEYGVIDENEQVVRHLGDHFPSHQNLFKVGQVEHFTHLDFFKTAKIDTVLELNVLEHLKDDARHISALMRYAPGGKIVLFVPAIPALYGTWDKDAGHYRRYNKRNITALMNGAGLTILYASYFNGVGAALWFLCCKVFKMKLNSEGTDQSIAVYDKWILPVAKLLDPILSRFFGQSLLLVAAIPEK